MAEERRILCIATGINFLFGIIVGIVLFYGQVRTDVSVFEQMKVYDTSISFYDFLKVSWHNSLWLLAIFISHNLLPSAYVHPVVVLRGCCSSFSAMYMLNFIGIKETVTAVIPQCFSILPLMLFYTAYTVRKRKELVQNAAEPFFIKRKDIGAVLMFSLICGGIEVLFYSLFSRYLF